MLILGPEAANAIHGSREHGKSIIAMLLKYYSSVEIGLMERYTIPNHNHQVQELSRKLQ